jgi:hypothetical protein
MDLFLAFELLEFHQAAHLNSPGAISSAAKHAAVQNFDISAGRSDWS